MFVSLGTINQCNDANRGLLRDCVKAAGNTLGNAQLDLNRASAAHLRARYGNRLTLQGIGSRIRYGLEKGMSHLGDDAAPWTIQTDVAPSITDVLPPDSTLPPASVWQAFKPTMPYVTTDVLRKAALLPNAPASIVAAAKQLPQAGPLSTITGSEWFSAEAIPGTGISRGMLAGGAAGLLALIVLSRRR